MRGQSTMWSGIVGGRGERQPLPRRVSVRLHFVASGPQHGRKFVLNFAVSRAASHLSCTMSLQLTPVLPLNWFCCALPRVEARICRERTGYSVPVVGAMVPSFLPPRRLRLFATR